MDIRNTVQKLCMKYKTTNPYHLADDLGIHVYYYDLGTIRGYYYGANKIKQIFLHNNLPEHLERSVLSHEIGHAIMHPRTSTPFLQTTLFSVDKLETETDKYGLPKEIIELRLK